MTRNKILIFGMVGVATLSGALYFAAQTLSPRAYAPTESSLTDLVNEEPLPEITLPIAPERPSITTTPPGTPPTGVRPATEGERSAYAAASPKPADSALIPKGFLDVVAYSYGKKDMLIAERPSAVTPSSVWKYDPSTRVISTLINGERGAMLARSSNGAFALSSQTLADGSISLMYEKILSKERRPLRFATIPPKCFLEGGRAVLYCGVPLSIPPRSIMPDDYLKRKFYTDDRIVRIDLENIRVEEIPTGTDIPLDIYEPRSISGTLVFMNRRDGAIYALPLP